MGKLTFQDFGSIGELIAAVATLLTLGYLAVQLRQNTRVLRSQTFQQSSMDMSLTANAISSSADLATIIVKASEGMGVLTSERSVSGFTSGCSWPFDGSKPSTFKESTAPSIQYELRGSSDLSSRFCQPEVLRNGGNLRKAHSARIL